ncbi:nickel pincer cofactor biosynthesis protein LarB [Caldicellulosiruptor acetigenus]|uniref:1-(5-phosphoribosyl)-5-amino-4-imidazole-carboxylate (AIR) carboxylase n=1 Tax=Caldicellulosiruptor acetigenus 6A TaxID=632516 RepID=G2PVW3_9FIRM|nr:nickel pincer cofactor biosynthesis protein LarB [Caldicellulosiruptor acetigenus]AEM73681.1 1-(5-phosphoribosyl)-5-amino-4-imidazole-carboxylate (AIR) carboxylase [Caldicellulosiruptor acetigenus 6A]
MDVRRILEDVRDGKISVDEALKAFAKMPFEDIDFAKIDHHRKLRQGMSEVIFCEGKTKEQVLKIFERMIERGEVNIIGTRASREQYEYLREHLKDDVVYYETGRIICAKRVEIIKNPKGHVAVVSAGTADLKVAEEAAIVLEILGNNVKRMYDVGVAGIHRLFAHLDDIQSANAVVAVAGMEGALASVVAGLVSKPVIAVPTSVGYGANFKGLSALLTMLNSCANGVCVVNIDNGFGAAIVAHMINSLANQNL